MRMFMSWILREIFGPKIGGEQEAGGLLHNEELHDSCLKMLLRWSNQGE
jgi:hypothetical protein